MELKYKRTLTIELRDEDVTVFLRMIRRAHLDTINLISIGAGKASDTYLTELEYERDLLLAMREDFARDFGTGI